MNSHVFLCMRNERDEPSFNMFVCLCLAAFLGDELAEELVHVHEVFLLFVRVTGELYSLLKDLPNQLQSLLKTAD